MQRAVCECADALMRCLRNGRTCAESTGLGRGTGQHIWFACRAKLSLTYVWATEEPGASHGLGRDRLHDGGRCLRTLFRGRQLKDNVPPELVWHWLPPRQEKRRHKIGVRGPLQRSKRGPEHASCCDKAQARDPPPFCDDIERRVTENCLRKRYTRGIWG
jgi:hypothetical protein